MIKTLDTFRRYSSYAALYLFNIFENNNNCDISKDGEDFVIKNILKPFIVRAKETSVIVDVGASVGEFSLHLIKEYHDSKILLHLFEPSRKSFDHLQKTLGAYENIRINCSGVDASEGKRKLFFDKNGSALGSLFERKVPGISFNRNMEVHVIRLDNYIKKYKIKHLKFLKIDVEGNELRALQSLGKYLSADFVDFIQFEYGGANIDARTYLRDIFDLLDKSGFVVGKIFPRYIRKTIYKPYMENFQMCNYIAISRNIVKKISAEHFLEPNNK